MAKPDKDYLNCFFKKPNYTKDTVTQAAALQNGLTLIVSKMNMLFSFYSQGTLSMRETRIKFSCTIQQLIFFNIIIINYIQKHIPPLG